MVCPALVYVAEEGATVKEREGVPPPDPFEFGIWISTLARTVRRLKAIMVRCPNGTILGTMGLKWPVTVTIRRYVLPVGLKLLSEFKPGAQKACGALIPSSHWIKISLPV